MNLENIFDIYTIDSDMRKTIQLIRHSKSEMGVYLFDQSVMEFYQAVQSKNQFQTGDHLLSFIVDQNEKVRLKGFFSVLRARPLEQRDIAKVNIPEHIAQHYYGHVGEWLYYDLKPAPGLEDMVDRLVVEWGKGTLAWKQKHHPKNPKIVSEILPKGFFRAFPGYPHVLLSRHEFAYLMENINGNPDWRSALSNTAGIYLILDRSSGQQYIGSATGQQGILGRWLNYYKQPHGNNKHLKAAIQANPSMVGELQYSILEVFPKNTPKNTVVTREHEIMRMLGSRVYGLNH